MLLLLPKEKLEVNLMLSFKALEEKKKTNVKINPKKNKTADPATAGAIKRRSFWVRPGNINASN